MPGRIRGQTVCGASLPLNTQDMSKPKAFKAAPFLWGAIGLAALAVGSTFIPRSGPALDPNLGIADPEAAASLALRPQEDHPVSPDMEAAAESLGSSAAPDFQLTDTEGKTHTLASLTKDKPLLIFFVEKECPCCLGAKHFVDRLAMAYRGQLNTVGIINAEGAVARAWVKATQPKFTLLQDPKMTAIQAYKAERGVYTTLIAPGGQIDKAWPGYSQEMLNDASARIAKIAGVPAKKIESAAAPEEMTSGCVFPAAEGEKA